MKQLITFLFLLLVSCKQEFPDVPKDIIPMKEMKLILADMHIADAIAEKKSEMGENEKALTLKYNEQIFKNHGTTPSEFNRSFKFYENNPVLLNKMYDDILNNLSKREEAEGGK